MAERVRLLAKPGAGRGRPRPEHRLGHLPEVPERMREVQNAHRIRALQIDEALQPVGTIKDRDHQGSRRGPTPVGF